MLKQFLRVSLRWSLLAIVAWGAWSAALNTTASAKPYAENELIIRYKSGPSLQDKQKFLGKFKALRKNEFRLINADLVQVGSERSVEDWIRLLKTNPLVQYVEPNYQVQAFASPPLPNDTYFSKLWGLHNTGQSGGVVDADIDAPEGWANYSCTASVVVAVVDTGVDYNHSDLTGNIWSNPDEKANGIDDDKNGYIDDIRGWDFVNRDNNPMDDNKQGTHVSGTIAAKVNNRSGVAGVAGQGCVKIMPLKFLNRSGSGYISDAIKAIEYATLKKARVASNSWGGGGYSQAMYDAMQKYEQSGGLFIVAAGNSTANNDTTPTYPASYSIANKIVVASMTNADILSSFSNYGLNSVDVAAPGSNILSTLPKNSFGSLSGTSMATPHVSGAAALYWSQFSSASAADVKSKILGTVRKVSALDGKVKTGGVINLDGLLNPAPAP